MEKRYIIALDEGTTSARSVVYDIKTDKITAISNQKFKQYYPKNGWVEQDPIDIWNAQKKTLNDVLSTININEVIGIGITNQRETVIAWNKETGEPIYNAIVWQCRRTSEMIDNIPKNIKTKIKNKTGLIPNAYFSASKIKWILDNVPKAKELAKKNQLCIGTVDSFLAYKLTGEFVTDTTNASRTMIFNINTLKYDKELLEYFGIPESCLPKVVDSNYEVGNCLEYPFPLCGIIGDQQSSLVGQACLKPGMAKATYGTGCFILMNMGQIAPKSKNMLSTIAYTINGKTYYALEGSVYSACNAINCLKDNLGLYDNVNDTAQICNSVSSTEGVYFVPAFTGLGAPYWTDNTRGAIFGMSLATNKKHIIRACFESIAYNTAIIINDMSNNEISIKELHVDGGGSKNTFLCQFQADILKKNILKSAISDSTAMGAVYMVGLSKKIFNLTKIQENYKVENTFKPTISKAKKDELLEGWNKAVETTIKHGIN